MSLLRRQSLICPTRNSGAWRNRSDSDLYQAQINEALAINHHDRLCPFDLTGRSNP